MAVAGRRMMLIDAIVEWTILYPLDDVSLASIDFDARTPYVRLTQISVRVEKKKYQSVNQFDRHT